MLDAPSIAKKTQTTPVGCCLACLRSTRKTLPRSSCLCYAAALSETILEGGRLTMHPRQTWCTRYRCHRRVHATGVLDENNPCTSPIPTRPRVVGAAKGPYNCDTHTGDVFMTRRPPWSYPSCSCAKTVRRARIIRDRVPTTPRHVKLAARYLPALRQLTAPVTPAPRCRNFARMTRTSVPATTPVYSRGINSSVRLGGNIWSTHTHTVNESLIPGTF